jgi:hypothetical protein
MPRGLEAFAANQAISEAIDAARATLVDWPVGDRVWVAVVWSEGSRSIGQAHRHAVEAQGQLIQVSSDRPAQEGSQTDAVVDSIEISRRPEDCSRTRPTFRTSPNGRRASCRCSATATAEETSNG